MKKQTDPLAALVNQGFEVIYLSHAGSILNGEFYRELGELVRVLSNLSLPITEIIGSGGGETKFTQRLRKSLALAGWTKHNFEIKKTIDGQPRESISHEVDHVKRVDGVGTLGCEIEWNNKDPFFDRDLENFKRLHAEGAISAGIVITRGSTLQAAMHDLVMRFAVSRGIADFEGLAAAGVVPTSKQRDKIAARTDRVRDPLPFVDAWVDNFVSNKFGQATTHWNKLMDRGGGVGSPCPLLLIGLPASIVVVDDAVVDQLDDESDATQI